MAPSANSTLDPRSLLDQAVIVTAGGLVPLPAFLRERGWVDAVKSGPPNLVPDAFNGLVAFIVAGPDAYSAAQDVTAAVPREALIAAVAAERGNTLEREGEYWTFRYRGSVSRIRERTGITYLATLLERPHEEAPALTLAAGRAPTRTASFAHVAQAGLHGGPLADVGDVLDARARAEYRDRLAELEAEVEEAEQNHDLGRLDRIRGEMDALRGALGAALGLGGGARRAGSLVERARVSVTRALRAAIARIRAVDADLGDHLGRSVRTGTFCRYAPAEPTQWVITWTAGRRAPHAV